MSPPDGEGGRAAPGGERALHITLSTLNHSRHAAAESFSTKNYRTQPSLFPPSCKMKFL
jgi:hypothetical protein